MVTMFPFTTAGPDRTEKLTVNPELAVAASGNGASPKVCRLNTPKLIVCGILATLKVRCTVTAAL